MSLRFLAQETSAGTQTTHEVEFVSCFCCIRCDVLVPIDGSRNFVFPEAGGVILSVTRPDTIDSFYCKECKETVQKVSEL